MYFPKMQKVVVLKTSAGLPTSGSRSSAFWAQKGRYSESIMGIYTTESPRISAAELLFTQEEKSIISPAKPITPKSTKAYPKISAYSILSGATAMILII